MPHTFQQYRFIQEMSCQPLIMVPPRINRLLLWLQIGFGAFSKLLYKVHGNIIPMLEPNISFHDNKEDILSQLNILAW